MSLSSCSRVPEYLQARSIAPILSPEGVDEQRLGQLYPVPDQALAPTEFSLPLPPMIGVQDSSNIASIQVFEDQTWLLNAKSPATTWSQVLGVLQAKAYVVAVQDLQNATIETGWSTRAVQPGFVIRYRFRFERGFQPNTTEIYMFNEKARADELDQHAGVWPDQVEDRAHRNLLVNEMVAVLNSPENVAGDSLLASTINLPEKLLLTALNKEPVLVAEAAQARLQSALANALRTKGLLIYDQSVDSSIFHIDTYRVKGEGSVWSRLSPDGPGKTSQYPLASIIKHLPNDPVVNTVFPEVGNREPETKLKGVPGYLLVQVPQGERVAIYIRDAYGKPLKTDKGRELLDLIRLRLI